jgi:tetratricopeptide (TPR) repeat protein
MASVFLSYDREDGQSARALAAAVEGAGHSVWWDRHIKGGAQFESEIEAALKAADKVVVLWSARSVRSAWVRDEAAVGRDSGRLVPVTLDGTEPPLGFRQYQTIDLAGWKKANSERLGPLLEALGPVTAATPATVVTAPRRARRERPRWLVAAPAAVVAMIIGGGWWWTSRGKEHTPIVAIASADDSQASRKVARELAIRLGDLQSARSSLFELVSGRTGDADLVLQVDAEDSADSLRRDLSILPGRDRSILWSTSLRQPPGKAGDLAQQVTLTSERVLSCALDALSDQRDRIDGTTLKLYLGGCSRLEQVYGNGEYDPSLIDLFKKVTAKAPYFEGAWAKLLTAEAEIARQPDPPAPLVADLRRHIAQVEKLGLDLGEIYAAKASLVPQRDFGRVMALYDQGIQADPTNPLLYRLRAEELQRVGRMSDAIYNAGAALKLDPLSPALQDNYASALAYGGKVDSAYEQLKAAEAMWPGASNLRFARYRLDLRFGDPKEALALFRATPGADPAQEAFILARIDPAPARIQRAIDEERVQLAQEPRYIAGVLQVLGQFGRTDEAIDVMLHYRRLDAIGFNAEVMFRPALREVWRDPRAIAAAAHLGFLRYWVQSQQWPDFCADPSLPYDCKAEAAKIGA